MMLVVDRGYHSPVRPRLQKVASVLEEKTARGHSLREVLRPVVSLAWT